MAMKPLPTKPATPTPSTSPAANPTRPATPSTANTPSTAARPAAKAEPSASPGGERLVSLDAYRGFVMLAMASAGLGVATVVKNNVDLQSSWFWREAAYQLDHVPWVGGGFWDMIQPSFMFIVGVAVPFSLANRKERGQAAWKTLAHALWRAIVLVVLGVFLASLGKPRTEYLFTNVLAQIGLGYFFVVLIAMRGWIVQSLALLGILIGYGLWFYLAAAPPDDFDYKEVGFYATKENFKPIPGQGPWEPLTGTFAHWNPSKNPAGDFDVLLLEQGLHRTDKYNSGGYQTLNFIPSMATILFGVMAGNWLRGKQTPSKRLLGLFAAGLVLLGIGWLAGMFLCPLVKRIWTPTWAVYSTGWTVLLLALFYLVIDIWGFKRMAVPLLIVGMNSIAIYMMASCMSGWVKENLRTHLGPVLAAIAPKLGLSAAVVPTDATATASAAASKPADAFASGFGPIALNALVVFVFWLVCLWMYRRKIFLRI